MATMYVAAVLAGTTAAPPPVASVVTRAPSQTIGEPMAAQDAAVSVVVATVFQSAGAGAGAGAVAKVWSKPATSGGWRSAGPLLPDGFASSYDAAAAAAPRGPLLVVAGTDTGGSCITDGSVALASVRSDGALSPARLVSDQRGTGSFDDRPTVAVGADGTVWVAWSQGRKPDACEPVGVTDRIEVAASHDGGRTFGVPVQMPAAGTNSAFGVRLTPLSGGRVAVSWTAKTGNQVVLLVAVIGPDGQMTKPRVVLSGAALPLVLPGASFYDFPAGDMAALPDGTLVAALPVWRSGRAVIAVAAGTADGTWHSSQVSPPSGTDLLLPGLAADGSSAARLVYAAHARAGDRLGYDESDITVGAGEVRSGGTLPLTSAPAGPGYFEIGEELSVSATPGGWLTALVVAGRDGATLQTEYWAAPPAPPVARPSPSPTPRATHRPHPRPAERSAGGLSSSALWAVILSVIVVGLLAAGMVRRSRARQRQ